LSQCKVEPRSTPVMGHQMDKREVDDVEVEEHEVDDEEPVANCQMMKLPELPMITTKLPDAETRTGGMEAAKPLVRPQE